MPKSLPTDLTDRLLAKAARHAGGVGIDALLAALGGGVSRRSLQRRLSELVAARRLIARGQGKARVYRVAADAGPLADQEAEGIPVSPEGAELRASRLGANIPFIKRNLSPLSFIDVPERDYIEGTLAIYELTRVELLRDLFAWAYERSAQRYSALRRSVVEPDPFRLAHRAQLIELVGDVVRRRLPADEPTVRRLAQTLVAGADLDQFVAMALNDLRHLYEGNVARYRLRLADYHGWKTAVGGHA